MFSLGTQRGYTGEGAVEPGDNGHEIWIITAQYYEVGPGILCI